jgi:hypothetical protein
MSDALYGKSLSDQNITNIVSTAVTAYSLPTDTNAVYFVLGAPDVTATSGFCTQYCGWHNYAVINGATLKYAFVGEERERECDLLPPLQPVTACCIALGARAEKLSAGT